MNLSYWEQKTWFSNIDYTITGSGIVGLFTALFLKEKFPKAKILILEKGSLPQGASTRNAGFACFGSMSELVSNLENESASDVAALVKMRWEGLHLLRKILSDKDIGYQNYGGYELFYDKKHFVKNNDKLIEVNNLLYPIFKENVFRLTPNTFNFKNCYPQLIYNPFEGQIDTGKMIASLIKKVQQKGITILNDFTLKNFQQGNNEVKINTNKIDFKTKNLILTTNGFSAKFFPTLLLDPVLPARGQILITRPIPNLKVKGTYHLEQGFYYFRNIDNRILLGGGRNLDIKGETTTEFGLTKRIQNKLENLLSTVILPDKSIEIEQRWSGIMGMGEHKMPTVKQLDNNIYCGVKLSGMGIAIGSKAGMKLSNLIINNHE
ncbi:MAG: FAD-dependent oxidoreductase [Flavobacteriales bacterium]|nr:MAG: FAD-dependent oxidoreductase [Flavobacteriales bacterium]